MPESTISPPSGPKNLAIDTLVATGRNLKIYDQPHTVLLKLGDAKVWVKSHNVNAINLIKHVRENVLC
jgi:hypothetical protein